MTPQPAAAEHAAILDRIRGEFIEMPGLKLTPAQARRLWGLDARTCALLLEELTHAGFLRRTPDGSVMRTGRSHAA